jgi:hypothetical protein
MRPPKNIPAKSKLEVISRSLVELKSDLKDGLASRKLKEIMCTASAALHTARDARTGKIEGVEVSEEGVGRETMVKPGNRWVVVWGGDRRYLRRLFR